MLLLTNKTIDKLKYDLVRDGLILLDNLNCAEEAALKNSTSLTDELIKNNFLSENQLLNFIEEKLHIPFVELKDYKPDINCLSYLDAGKAKKYNILPLFKIEDVLTVAMADPLDLFSINNLFSDKAINIEPVFCTMSAIQEAIDKYYNASSQKPEQSSAWQEIIIADNIDENGINKAISDIIEDAINNNISFILMETSKSGLNVFFDKELKGYIPDLLVARLIYELKKKAKLDISNVNIPQNSTFIFNFNNSNYKILVSIFPTKYGVRISLIINKPLKSIEDYNLDKSKLDNIFSKPAIIALKNVNSTDLNIFAYSLAEYFSQTHSVIMLENKVFYELNSVTQVEINNNFMENFQNLINNIELQKFDILFIDKISNPKSAKQLENFAKTKIVVTQFKDEFLAFNYIISTDGTIIKEQ